MEVFCCGLYPNRFIVENKKENSTWVYPMRLVEEKVDFKEKRLSMQKCTGRFYIERF